MLFWATLKVHSCVISLLSASDSVKEMGLEMEIYGTDVLRLKNSGVQRRLIYFISCLMPFLMELQ